MENEKERLLNNLAERIKELNCLYGLSRVVELYDSVEEMLRETVKILPQAWQYPDITCARITFDKLEFSSSCLCSSLDECDRRTVSELTSSIRIHDQIRGEVSIHYLEEKPEQFEGPFLKEERELLNAVVERLGRIIERIQAEEMLKKSEKRLKEAQRVGTVGDWEFDVETRQITWSEQGYRLFERDPAQGPPTYEENMAYYYPEDSKKLQEQMRRAIECDEDFDTDYHLKLPGGKSVYQRGLIRTIKDENGNVIKLYGTLQDITARKRISVST